MSPNHTPVIGGLVLFKYTNNYHVAVIKEFREEGVWVVEGNKKPCQRTERLVLWSDAYIRGFWYPDIREKQIVYGYSSEVEQTDNTPFLTASQTNVQRGIVANNCQPFGTKVRIAGKEYVVEDRMSTRYTCNTWDIWFPDTDDAVKWGKQVLDVEIL